MRLRVQLRGRRYRPPLGAALGVLAFVAAAALIATWARDHGGDVTLCNFHRWTGFACPSCGCTRAGLSLLQGRALTALELQPLFTLAVVLVAPLVLLHYGWGLRVRLDANRGERRALLVVAVLAVVVNWTWLIHAGV